MSTKTYTSMDEIMEVLEWAANQVGFPLDELDRINVSFNNRFTRRIGDANFSKRRIRFSAPLWPQATPEDRRETIVHEFCHIADRYFGNRARGVHHGPSWKRLMRMCGYAGNRCHNVAPEMRRRNKGTKEYTCGCKDKSHFLGKKRSARHARYIAIGNPGYRCRVCKDSLRLKN